MDIKLDISRDYENKRDWTLGENKPNSKPIKANLHLTAENAEYAEKKDICVSDCPIEKYALYHISPRSGLGHPVDLRTRRLMENKAKQSQLVKTSTRPKTQGTRPKIQVLSLKSGV